MGGDWSEGTTQQNDELMHWIHKLKWIDWVSTDAFNKCIKYQSSAMKFRVIEIFQRGCHTVFMFEVHTSLGVVCYPVFSGIPYWMRLMIEYGMGWPTISNRRGMSVQGETIHSCRTVNWNLFCIHNDIYEQKKKNSRNVPLLVFQIVPNYIFAQFAAWFLFCASLIRD